jgi:uroporphyrinogen decarboxylase
MWDRFLRACRREPVDATPVWFMRQAGRYMAEYRKLREKHTLLEICKEPDLATEVTLQPVRAHKVDAAILFADILLPLEPMGAPFEFTKGEGPRFYEPIRDRTGIEKLRVIDPKEDLSHVLQAVTNIRRELDGKTPLIGFSGAPFTLASYLIEGGKSSQFTKTKALMFGEPELWGQLMTKLSEVVRRFLLAQIEAGAQAVQVFDSWVGQLSPADYREFIQPYLRPVFAALEATSVPVIHFGTDTSTLLEVQKETGGTVIGADWRIPLSVVRRRMGDDVAIQGNLDPNLLCAPRERLHKGVRAVLEAAGSAPGHIFNLGHGIFPQTPPSAVTEVADLVHTLTERH